MKTSLPPCFSRSTLVVAVVLTFLICSCITELHADVIFTLGNVPQPDEANILLNKGMSGTTVMGTPNGFPQFTVNFTSSQTLLEPSSGQARVSGDPEGTPLVNMTISLANSATYGDLIINPFLDGCSACVPGVATVTVDAVNSMGVPETPAVFNYALGSGNNFLTITTTGGEKIVTTSIVDSGSFNDVRQPRISGLAEIPEPGTLLLLGTGALGLFGPIRRKLLPRGNR